MKMNMTEMLKSQVSLPYIIPSHIWILHLKHVK